MGQSNAFASAGDIWTKGTFDEFVAALAHVSVQSVVAVGIPEAEGQSYTRAVILPRRLSLVLSLALGLAAALALASSGSDANATPAPTRIRTLDDYKHFRVASIDLVGRAPTRDEIAQFEQPEFDMDKWTDQHLSGPAYAERLTRIYMDVLRLEPNLNFSSGPAQLYREPIMGPDGKQIYVFYRAGQRRAREATDAKFCLTQEETGLLVRPNVKQIGDPIKVSKAILDKYTTLVKPWWLYKDYRSVAPKELYGETWTDADPQFRPVATLLKNDDGKSTTEVRICKEEAQTAETGKIYASGRPKPAADMKAAAKPGAKKDPSAAAVKNDKTAKKDKQTPKPPPVDKPFATQHQGDPVACGTKLGLDTAIDCGCGIGLERCVPNDGVGQGAAFEYPNHAPLGPDEPLDSGRQLAQRWFPYWWSRESVQFISDIFASDRDFRQILTGKQTFVNGPLAQFYKVVQRGNCCGPEANFGMREESEPLFDPAKVPTDLAPQETSKWEYVQDRGQHAAGLLTMPMFLEKFASARARGAAVYNAFLCKSFNAENAELTPSSEANLMKRPGCQACHATLEPLAASKARSARWRSRKGKSRRRSTSRTRILRVRSTTSPTRRASAR